MSTWVLIIHAEDGMYNTVHETKASALQGLVEQIGHDHYFGEALKIGRSYVDDWGRLMCIEERPDGHTAEAEDDLREAFDARECGYAGAEQIALLAKNNL